MKSMMNNKPIDKFCGSVSVIMVLLLLSTASVWASNAQLRRSLNSEANQKLAIKKTGFYLGVDRGMVTIMDEKSYKKRSYKAAPEMIFTRHVENADVNVKSDPDDRVEIKPESLLSHSIVELIIVNAEVVEIVLLVETS